MLAPILLASILITTVVHGCTYRDGCNSGHVNAPPGGLLTDSCRNVWRVDANCRLSYLTTTSKWMRTLHGHAFHSLAVPGSHDSAAYQMKYPVHSHARHWSLRQHLTIYSQLNAGIRFLDIGLRKEGTVVMTSHRYYMVPFSKVASDIIRFVSENPSEVVAIELSKDRSAGADASLSFHDIYRVALDSFGSRMQYGFSSSTLGKLVELKKNVIVNPHRTWQTITTQYGGQLCKTLQTFTKGATSLNVIAMSVTPDSNAIANGEPIGAHDSLRSATAALKPAVLWPFIDAQSGPAFSVLSMSNAVYLHDFVESATVGKVLLLNYDSRREKKFRCVRPSCARYIDCPSETPVCRNADNTKLHKFTCEPRQSLDAQCSLDSSCVSRSCFAVATIRGRCQCNPCHGSACGGCPSGLYCAKMDSITQNVCRPWFAWLRQDGHECVSSSHCLSACCSDNFWGKDTCETNTMWRRCI